MILLMQDDSSYHRSNCVERIAFLEKEGELTDWDEAELRYISQDAEDAFAQERMLALAEEEPSRLRQSKAYLLIALKLRQQGYFEQPKIYFENVVELGYPVDTVWAEVALSNMDNFQDIK